MSCCHHYDFIDGKEHVFAVDPYRCVGTVAQGHVQHRAILGPIDLLAREHRPGLVGHAGRCGQFAQAPQGLLAAYVLRIVQQDSEFAVIDRQVVESLPVFEKVAQVGACE